MRYFLCIVFCLITSNAHAFTIKVKAGEHEGFSRLVIYTGGQQAVKVAIDIAKIRIEYGQRIDAIDTTQAFSRLQSDRIENIYADKQSLVIDLKCDCRAKKLTTKFGQLYFDIREADVSPLSLPLFLATPNITQPVDAIKKPNYEFEQKLLENALFSATESKILNRANEPEQINAIDVTKSKDVAIDLANLAIDEQHVSERLENANGVECLDSDKLNFSNWSDNTSFTIQVSEHLKSLTQEFDIVDLESLERLIKVYIFYGMGAEAKQLIQLYSEDVPQELYAIAQMLHDPDVENEYFLGQETCNGPSSLWSVIAAGDRLYSINSDQIFLAYSALPKHMKSILTEPLVANLHKNKFAETAQKIASLSDKVASSIEGHAEMVIANTVDSPEDTLQLIENELNSSTEISPDMAIKYVALKMSTNSAIAPKFVKILEGVVWDFRHSSEGATLENALMLAYLLSSDFDAFLLKMASVDWMPEYKFQAQELINENTPDDVLLRITKSEIFAPNDRFQDRLAKMGLGQDLPVNVDEYPVTRPSDPKVRSGDNPVSTAQLMLDASNETRKETIDRFSALGIVF